MMDFEHTLLLIFFILPLAYKIAFWKEIFSQNEKIIKNIGLGYSHFFSYIELPLFFGSLVLYKNADFEIFFYNFFLYFFGLVHIFIIGRIIRKKNILGSHPLYNIMLSFLIAGICFFIGDFFGSLWIYLSMLFSYLIGALLYGYKERRL